MAASVRFAALASGSGTNLQALIDADLGPGEIAFVLVNKAGAKALERAQKAKIPAETLLHADFPSREAFDAELVRRLKAQRIDWVILAGFMRLLTPTFLSAFENRVLNIHPALLPAFPGTHAQRQAFEAKVRISGCTVHLVDSGMDTGPILAQAAVPILPSDTLADLQARILRQEHQLYPRVVRAAAEGRVRQGPAGWQIEGAQNQPEAALLSPAEVLA